MSFSLTVKLFAVVMAICIFGLFRPISCRVALSRSKDDLQSSESRAVHKCYRECRQLQSMALNVHDFKKPYKDCWKQCIVQQDEKGAAFGAEPKRNLKPQDPSASVLERVRRSNFPNGSNIILSPGQPSPTNLLTGSNFPPPPPFTAGPPGSCDPLLLIPRNTTVATVFHVECREPRNSLKKAFVVHWKEPTGDLPSNCNNFQVNFQITPRDEVPDPVTKCRQVKRDVYSYTIGDVDKTDRLDVLVVLCPGLSSGSVPMQNFKPCLPTDSPTQTPTRPPSDSNTIFAVTFFAIVVVLSSLAAILVYYKRRTRSPSSRDVHQDVTEQVYVSYYADSERYHSSLQNLVAKLRRAYFVNLIMDSYCQTEVAELGLARWCQRKLSVSTRIVMVVSKEYLKICENWQQDAADVLELDSVNVNRVCTELQYIVNHIFEKGRNSLLTIILADVNHRDLPDQFRGMNTFQWPENEDQEHAIACNICGKEAITA